MQITSLHSASSTQLLTGHCPHSLLNAVLRCHCSWASAAVEWCRACRALSSKPTAHRRGCETMGQTHGQMDAQLLHRPCSAYYAGNVNKLCTFPRISKPKYCPCLHLYKLHTCNVLQCTTVTRLVIYSQIFTTSPWQIASAQFKTVC